MRILVVGGTGFIGTPLVRQLQAGGYEVAIYSRGEKPLPTGVLAIEGTRREVAAAQDAIDAFDPEVVVDILAMTDAETRPLFEFFAPRACRYVMISSCDVYQVFGRLLGTEPGAVIEGPLDETAPLREVLYPYDQMETVRMPGYDKIPLERLLFDLFGDRGTVTRLPMITGSGDRQHRFRDPAAHFGAGRDFILLPETYAGWTSTYGHIENVAAAIACATTDAKAGGEIFNVGELPKQTQRDWYVALGQALQWKGEVIVAPAEDLPEQRAALSSEAYRQDLLIDASKLERLLGFLPPIAFEAAVLDIARWEAAHLDGIEASYDFAADDAWASAR